jgi:hypothetical protein
MGKGEPKSSWLGNECVDWRLLPVLSRISCLVLLRIRLRKVPEAWFPGSEVSERLSMFSTTNQSLHEKVVGGPKSPRTTASGKN